MSNNPFDLDMNKPTYVLNTYSLTEDDKFTVVIQTEDNNKYTNIELRAKAIDHLLDINFKDFKSNDQYIDEKFWISVLDRIGRSIKSEWPVDQNMKNIETAKFFIDYFIEQNREKMLEFIHILDNKDDDDDIDFFTREK